MPCTRELVLEQSPAPFITYSLCLWKVFFFWQQHSVALVALCWCSLRFGSHFWVTVLVLCPQFLMVAWLCWPLWACSINKSGDTVTKEGLAHLSNTARSKIQASVPVWAPGQYSTSPFISLTMNICRNCESFPCNCMTSGKQVIFIISLYF